MTGSKSKDALLRSQIEAAAKVSYSAAAIEAEIVDSLCSCGEYDSQIDAADLSAILRNVVYTMFKEYRLAGLDVHPLHNVPVMEVEIEGGEAQVSYIVHIHKPIIAFLSFQYSIVNDQSGRLPKLKIKARSFKYRERTRRYDLKAKAALKAVNIRNLALRELRDVSNVILQTLPSQMEHYGVSGDLRDVELQLDGHTLHICLRGEFSRHPQDTPEKEPLIRQQVLPASTSSA